MATNYFPETSVFLPPAPDPLAAYQKIVTLRNAIQQQQYQQQMQPLQLQAEQQTVEQQRRQMQSQQALTQAYIDADGDLDQTMAHARRSGVVLPNDMIALQEHALKVKDQYASMTKTQLENTSAQHDNLRGVFDPIANETDPAKQQQLYTNAKQMILSDPQAAIKYGVTNPAQIPDYQNPQQIQLYDAALKGGKAQVEDELKAAQTFEAQQRGKQIQQQQALGGTPEMQDVRYTNLKAQQAQGKQLGADDAAFVQGYEARKLLVPQFRVENRQGPQGTWSLQEDTKGNPVLLNSATGEVRPAPGVQKTGTYQKTVGGPQAAVNYANTYLQGGQFSGPGDEALMEQYFEMAKPSSGFRMSQVQTDMLMKSRAWMQSAEGEAYHARYGTWFAPQQRQQIVQTMQALGTAKGISGGAATTGGGGAAAGFTRVRTSDGQQHDVPTANLDAARKIDPGLQVVK